jgi:hypothetical protein
VSAVVSSHVMDNWQLVFYMGGPGLSVHFIIPSMPMPMSIPIPSFGGGKVTGVCGLDGVGVGACSHGSPPAYTVAARLAISGSCCSCSLGLGVRTVFLDIWSFHWCWGARSVSHGSPPAPHDLALSGPVRRSHACSFWENETSGWLSFAHGPMDTGVARVLYPYPSSACARWS